MPDLSQLVGGPDDHGLPLALAGIVTKPPARVADPLFVVVPSFSTDFNFEVLAGRWAPRDGALPQKDDRCLVVLDEHGDAYAPTWESRVGGLTATLLWSYRVAGHEPSYSSPIVAVIDGAPVVIFQSWDWYLYVLRLDTGALVWRKAFGDSNYGRAQAGDVNGDGAIEVFGASHDGKIWSLDEDGGNRWQYTGGGMFQHAGTLVQESGGWFLYVTGFDDTCVKLNADTGAVVWTFTAGEDNEPYPLVQDVDGDGATECLFSSVDGHVYCLNTATGAAKWSTVPDERTGQGLDAFLAAADIDGDGTIEILASCRDNRVYVLDGVTGAVKAHTTDTGGDIDTRPAVLADGSFIFANDVGYTFCCTPDGLERWRRPTALGIGMNSSPTRFELGGRELVAVCDMSGGITFFDGAGTVVEAVVAPGGIEGTPLIGDFDGQGMKLVVCTLDGYCCVYRLSLV